MSEKEIKRLTDLAKNRLKKRVSKEEALHTFIMAGILDNEGQFTENYPHLAAVVVPVKK
ncbi:MAG TPA: hypothetical protein VIH57_06705 [Bacteroidales bacterium]